MNAAKNHENLMKPDEFKMCGAEQKIHDQGS